MNNEKLLQMLGEIDEKHLRDANRDVELWLEERGGVRVPTERPVKTPRWKIVTAAVCSAAAVFGVAALSMNVLKLGKLNNAVYSDNTSESSSNSPISETLFDPLSEYVIDNLDYKDADVVENVPNSGVWKKMTYATPGIDENSADRMAKIAAAYGSPINKDDICLRMWNLDNTFKGNVPLSDVYLPAYSNFQYTDRSKIPYNSMFCLSDDIFIEIDEPGYGWIELDNRKAVTEIAGAERYRDFTGTWRPSSEYVFATVVDPTDGEAVCVLNGKTVKVADAVRNAQKIMTENDGVFPKDFETEPKGKIWVYTYENGNQGLSMTFDYSYDGVPFASAPSHDTNEGRTSNNWGTCSVHCGMLTESSIDWVLSYTMIDGTTEFTSEDCELTVSREDALKKVSQKLSHDETFTVNKQQLLYTTRRTDGGRSFVAEPTWAFELTHRIGKYVTEKLYFYVNAVDGSVQIFEQNQHAWY